ncbi:hypothetical protein Val02_53590 [Virgisporangium aliadipatigenens]|uniref:Uncharacterized protein n=1 Tax=Virgisporangium aliadipatigenens TaxID=741659 RepID=A0A8J3YRK7_9ACTN|nr:hypothetical protein Val02_53590 [Virgisporangium aliadipatigenens]
MPILRSSAADRAKKIYDKGAVRGALAIAGTWHFGNDLPAALLTWQKVHPAGLGLAVWCAYTVVGVVAAVALLRGRRLEPFAVWICTAVLLAGTAALHLSAGSGGIFEWPNWAWGAVGWLGLLVLWRHDVEATVAFLSANAIITTAALLSSTGPDRYQLAMLLGVVYGTASLQLGALLGARMITETARRAAAAREAGDRVLARGIAAEETRLERRRRYATARAAAEDLLAGLAGGALDPDDPMVRARCAIAAARLRRLVTETDDVPDPLLHDLRAAADVAERRGAAVTLDQVGAVGDLPTEVRQALVEAPTEVLAAAHGTARVTVVSTGDDISVSVLADGDTPGVVGPPPGADVSLSVEREDGQLWVQTRWRRSAQPSSTTTKSSSTVSVPGQRQTRSTASTSS